MKRNVVVLCLGFATSCAAVGVSGSTSSTPVAFDVHVVASGMKTLRLTDPSGKRLVVADDRVTISEIGGVDAGVDRVNDLGAEEAGDASVEINMTKPLSGLWRVEVEVASRSTVSLTASTETDDPCGTNDDLTIQAHQKRSWQLEVGASGKCPLDLKRLRAPTTKSKRK